MSLPLTEEEIRALKRGNKLYMSWKGKRNREKFIKESDAAEEFIEFLDSKEVCMFDTFSETDTDIFRFSSAKCAFLFHIRYLRDVNIMFETTPFGNLCDRIREKYRRKNNEDS
jgi:hypothetical protein